MVSSEVTIAGVVVAVVLAAAAFVLAALRSGPVININQNSPGASQGNTSLRGTIQGIAPIEEQQ